MVFFVFYFNGFLWRGSREKTRAQRPQSVRDNAMSCLSFFYLHAKWTPSTPDKSAIMSCNTVKYLLSMVRSACLMLIFH